MAYVPTQLHIPETARLQDPMELRKLRQTQLLNQAWNESLVSEADPNDPNSRVGDVDPRKFYMKAKDLGLDPDSAAAALAWKQKQYQAVSGMSDIADTMAAKRPGFDVNQAIGRTGAQFGEPQAQYHDISTVGSTMAPPPQAPKETAGVAVAPPTAEKPKTSWTDVGAAVGMKSADAQTAPAAAQQQQPGVDGTVNVTASAPATSQTPTMQLPELPPQPQTSYFTTPVDKRTWDEAALDKYMALPFGGATTAAPAGPDFANDPMFQWAPENDKSNVYQQFGSALTQQLNSAGYKDANDYLAQTYSAAHDAHLKPVPDQMLLAMGPEAKKTYYQMMAERRQSMVEADAIGRKAVMDARAGLTDAAKKYGESAIEQRKTELPEDYVLRDPSKRNEAAALITNRQNARYASDAVAAAGLDTVKLGLALPQVIRSYATAINPSAQLSEVNMHEIAAGVYPEQATSKEFMVKAAFAIGRLIRNGDTSGIDQLTNAIDASDPRALQARLARIAQEAQHLNEINLRNYVIPAPRKESMDTKKQAPAAQAPYKPSPNADEADQANMDRYADWQADQQRQFQQQKAPAAKPKNPGNAAAVAKTIGFKGKKPLSAVGKALRAEGF